MSYRRLRQVILLVVGLVLVLSAVSYSNLLQRGYVVIKFAALLTGATGLLALCGYLLFQDRRWRELRDPLFYLLAAEVGVLVLSVAFSGQPVVSFLGSMPRLMGAITVLSFLVVAVAVAVGAGRRRENLLFLLRIGAATAVGIGLNAIYEWPSHPIFRPPGLVGNAEFLSNYLLFGSLGSLGLMLVERRRGWWIFAAVAAAVASVAMAVLKTRGAWLGFGAGIVVFLLLVRPWKLPEPLVKRTLRRLLLLLGVAFVTASLAAIFGYAKAIKPIGWHAMLPFLPVMGMAFLLLPFALPKVKVLRYVLVGAIVAVTSVVGYSVATQTSILPYKVGSALRVTQESARGIVREDTVSMLSKYWLTGCGIENFRVAFLEFKSERVARADPRVNYRNPHNVLLYEWTANGLPGVLVYVGLILVGFWSLLLARRREEDSPWGLLSLGLLATLVAYLVHNFFNYDVIPTGLMFYVLLAMAMVLRRNAGKAPAKKRAEGDTSPEASEDDAPPAGPKGKRKRKRKKGALSGRERRLAQREEEQRELRSRWMVTSLIWGGGGLVALFFILWGVPSIKEAFSFSIADLKQLGVQVEVKTDILPWILLVSWTGFWLVTLLCGNIFRPGRPEDADSAEDAAMPRHAWLALAPILALCVGVGAWWSSRQIQADYHMFRALAYSRAAGRNVIPRVSRLMGELRSLQQQQRMLRRQGRLSEELADRIQARRRRLLWQSKRLAPVLKDLLRKAMSHGRAGAAAVGMLGYYHFQYSKVLHAFLKARGALPGHADIVMESLRHARRAVKNNTNPESAWSHLSVVYLAAGSLRQEGAKPVGSPWVQSRYRWLQDHVRAHSLSLAKWALARSISYDKFYYDTHRMMALLHLQSGHIDRALAEMNRSMDITEGRHFVKSHEAALQVKEGVAKGDDAAARKAAGRMWYWLERSRNFPGMPVMPISWLHWDDAFQRLQSLSKLIARGKLRQARKRISSLARLRGVARVPSFDLRFLRGVHAALAGDMGEAFSLLHHLKRPKKEEGFIDAVIHLVTGSARVEMDIGQLVRVLRRGKDARGRSRRAFGQAVERAMSSPHLYLKVFGFVISDHVDNGQMDEAKLVASAAARFAYLLYSRRRVDHFSPGFRRAYRQVISARGQVLAAATKRGRMMRAQRAMQRKRFQAVVRITRGALKKFGPKIPMAHFFMGSALEALGRPEEARRALELYLKHDPNGKYADKVKERLKSL